MISERKIKENYKKISRAFKTLYENTKVAYAYKANPTLAVCRILNEEGAMAEVISTGELFIAKSVGVDGSKIIFNGCNKDRDGIRLAIKMGVLINVDSFQELKIIEKEAVKLDMRARIGIRINPVVRAGTIDVWETALDNSKFGITMEKGIKAYKEAKKMKNIDILGIHTHIGSQVENKNSYSTAMKRIMDFLHELKKELGIDIEVIDIGGGLPTPFKYREIPSVHEYASAIVDVLNEKRDTYNLGNPVLILEPGGGIIGSAAILLLKVGMVKREESAKKWACVDGGANVNLRATQGWYVYQIVCCNKITQEKKEKINIGGPLCYTGDVLGYERELPQLEEGDILAMLDCGAYTMATVNRYNSYPLPAIILLKENEVKLVKKRESLSDLIADEEIFI